MKQIDNNRDLTNFSPVLGGYYVNGTLNYESTHGDWWSSVTYNGARRYRLYYNGSGLYTGDRNRIGGLYIRCVSEEKTVTDLTYLQDMTGEIANNTLDGTAASLTDTSLQSHGHQPYGFLAFLSRLRYNYINGSRT